VERADRLTMLHLTKVAFGTQSIDTLAAWIEERSAQGALFLTTRNLPKRHAEIAGQGSLFWIFKHQLVARSPILAFGEAEAGRVAIRLASPLIAVHPSPKRAHQGWRYLEAADAPADLGAEMSGEVLPSRLARDLAALGLI